MPYSAEVLPLLQKNLINREIKLKYSGEELADLALSQFKL